MDDPADIRSASMAVNARCRRERMATISFRNHSGWAGAATLYPILFCFAVFLGSPVVDQARADGGGVPQDASQLAPSPEKYEQQQALERERSTAELLRRELAKARMELAAARSQALAAQALAEEQRDLAAREREINAAVQQGFVTLRKDIDALKAGGAHEEDLRRALAAARQDLADMRRIGENARTPPAAKPTAKQEPELEEQRTKARELARDLALAQSKLERVRAEAIAARSATDASLAETSRAFGQERQKVMLLEHDLTEARQSIETLEASAKLTAAEQADLLEGERFAKAAAKQAGEALDRERERASAVGNDVEVARRERDAALQALARVSAASKDALEQEREKTIALTRALSSARKDIDGVKRRPDRAARYATKASAVTDVSERPAARRPVPKSGLPATVMLPTALLPTRPPATGSQP